MRKKKRLITVVMALVLTVALAVPLVGPAAPPAQADEGGDHTHAISSFALDVSNEDPEGLGRVSGSTFFIPDDDDNTVYDTTPSSFSTDSANANLKGVAVSGGKVYVLDSSDDMVYRYTTGGTYEAASRKLEDTGGGDIASPEGIAIDGDDMWVAANGSDNDLYRYSLSSAFGAGGDYSALQMINLDSSNNDAEGLAIDATYLYVLDESDEMFYRYQRNGLGSATLSPTLHATLGEGHDQDLNDPRGATLDGTSMWVVDDDLLKVYEYSMSNLFPETICDDAIDNDGDGDTDCDDSDCMIDADSDTYYAAPCGTDCDDSVASCTTDCVTDVDNDLIADCADTCIDADGDGYGLAGGAGNTCTGPDCNDDDPNLNIMSTEDCIGWVNPSSNAADAGDGFEVTPQNAYTDGGGNAANMNGDGDSHRYYGYDFSSIPAGSTIDGIAVRLDWWLDSTSGTNRIYVDLSWDGGTSWTSTKTASDEGTSDENPTDVEGGPSDTWGRSWNLAAGELSASNFMVRLDCDASYSTRDFYLDWVPVEVCYTLPDGYISLTPDTDTNCVGSDHTVTATIVGDTGGTTVTFNVTGGPNSGDTGDVVTDLCGMASWTYTGDGGAGTDTIDASHTPVGAGPITSDPVSKTWVADPGPPTTQLVMMLDGSGSINATEWSIMINGLAAAVNSSECLPADGSVELTVIQFADNARLEVGPVVIDDTDGDPTNDASAVAGLIESITKYPGDGYTCIACAIYLAQDVLLNHPDSNFNICRKQALNLVTDGVPNRRADSDGGTSGPEWEWSNSGSSNAANSAVNARNYAIAQLQMTEDQDEFDAEGIGITTDNKNWLRDSIVWPQPGYEDWLPTGPGWVRVVDTFQDFADTICEKFQIIVPTGACCDPATGICTDDVFEADCQAPLEWTEDVLCANLDPPCEPPTGACCDPATGSCTDDVLEAGCQAPLEWTEGETCAQVVCEPPTGACCDPATGSCTDDVLEANCQAPLEWTEGESCAQVVCEPPECTTDGDCDDGDVCTTDTCVDGTCQNENNTEPCDDGDACTTGDTCADGACVPGTPDCTTDADCDDLNADTDDTCDDGCCVYSSVVEPPPQVGVPTLTQWGMIAMGILFAAFLIWTVRRRWAVSSGGSQE